MGPMGRRSLYYPLNQLQKLLDKTTQLLQPLSQGSQVIIWVVGHPTDRKTCPQEMCTKMIASGIALYLTSSVYGPQKQLWVVKVVLYTQNSMSLNPFMVHPYGSQNFLWSVGPPRKVTWHLAIFSKSQGLPTTLFYLVRSVEAIRKSSPPLVKFQIPSSLLTRPS